jgi:hypothetical protein
MTLSIPFTFHGTGTGPDIAGRRQSAGQQLPRFRPPVLALVSPTGNGSQPAPFKRSADHSGLWLRNAAAGLGVLAAAAAAVSFTAQYRMAETARHLPAIAALEAAIPDATALVFACLSIALALHGPAAPSAPGRSTWPLPPPWPGSAPGSWPNARSPPAAGRRPHRIRGRRPRRPGSWIWSPNGTGLSPNSRSTASPGSPPPWRPWPT